MPSRSKQTRSGGKSPKRKGVSAERELVKELESYGFPVRRAWGSDGRSMGFPEGVDVVWDAYDSTNPEWAPPHYFQVKSRKALPKWLQIPEGCDAVAIRIDRDGWYLLQRLEDAL